MFSTKEVLKIAREAEEKTVVNKVYKRYKPSLIIVEMIKTNVDMSKSNIS